MEPALLAVVDASEPSILNRKTVEIGKLEGVLVPLLAILWMDKIQLPTT